MGRVRQVGRVGQVRQVGQQVGGLGRLRGLGQVRAVYKRGGYVKSLCNSGFIYAISFSYTLCTNYLQDKVMIFISLKTFKTAFYSIYKSTLINYNIYNEVFYQIPVNYFLIRLFIEFYLSHSSLNFLRSSLSS